MQKCTFQLQNRFQPHLVIFPLQMQNKAKNGMKIEDVNLKNYIREHLLIRTDACFRWTKRFPQWNLLYPGLIVTTSDLDNLLLRSNNENTKMKHFLFFNLNGKWFFKKIHLQIYALWSPSPSSETTLHWEKEVSPFDFDSFKPLLSVRLQPPAHF